MLEKHYETLLPTPLFLLRLLKNAIFAVIIIIIALGIGMWGYHFYEKMSWVDAYANASMILSGMGPLTPLNTFGGKIFAGSYAIFSGLLFIVIIGVIFGPIFHRFIHKFHMDIDARVRKKKKR